MLRELVFLCDNIVNVITIRSCLRRKTLHSLGSKGIVRESSWIVWEQPGFGDHSDSPASYISRTAQEKPGFG